MITKLHGSELSCARIVLNAVSQCRKRRMEKPSGRNGRRHAQQAAVAVQQAAMVAAQQSFLSSGTVRMSNVSMGQPDMVKSRNGWNQPDSIAVG